MKLLMSVAKPIDKYAFLMTLSLKKQEPGWTWYIGHPIKFIMRNTIFDCFDYFGSF